MEEEMEIRWHEVLPTFLLLDFHIRFFTLNYNDQMYGQWNSPA